MKFKFIWVGKTKDKNWRALQEEYLSRLSHFVRHDIVEIKDGGKELEGNRIIEQLNQSSLVCTLEVGGTAISSHGLASWIEDLQNRGLKEVTFVIGGADGLESKVLEKSDIGLSLSLLTLTHETARVVLVEQLYRAFTIIKGFPYQK